MSYLYKHVREFLLADPLGKVEWARHQRVLNHIRELEYVWLVPKKDIRHLHRVEDHLFQENIRELVLKAAIRNRAAGLIGQPWAP